VKAVLIGEYDRNELPKFADLKKKLSN